MTLSRLASSQHPARVIDAGGLALSGGGIRSASVALGVLQALDHHGALHRLDYLSTVSGGGYMGSSLTATMTKDDGRFVLSKVWSCASSSRSSSASARPPRFNPLGRSRVGISASDH